jgi:hypothetical protein
MDRDHRRKLLEGAQRAQQALQIRRCARPRDGRRAPRRATPRRAALAVSLRPRRVPARARAPRAVTTTLTQKTGASVQTATSQYWDGASDSYVAYKYENDQMQALTTVYGITI